MAEETRAEWTDLEAAASAVSQESLDKARSAIKVDCRELIRWAGVLSESLESRVNDAGDARRFARAAALCLLGHLPTNPRTCPFCIQYSGEGSCTGCGYALTHGGRCDEDTSAFSRFIEAFQDLGKAIYQDIYDQDAHDQDAHDQAIVDKQGLISNKGKLRRCLIESSGLAEKMIEDMSSAPAQGLMDLKASYMSQMIALLPLDMLSDEVRERQKEVLKKLLSYW